MAYSGGILKMLEEVLVLSVNVNCGKMNNWMRALRADKNSG